MTVNKAKVIQDNDVIVLETCDRWNEVISIPYDWVLSGVGMYERNSVLYPVENLTKQRSLFKS